MDCLFINFESNIFLTYQLVWLFLVEILDITISLTEVQGDGEEARDVVKEDDYSQEPFNVWCAKMNVFFKNVFFPAAQRYELLNNIALEKLKWSTLKNVTVEFNYFDETEEGQMS